MYLIPQAPFPWVDFPPSVNRLIGQGRLARLGPPDEVITRESLREVYGVEVTVTEVAGADGRAVRVCVPALGATGRGARSGAPEHRS